MSLRLKRIRLARRVLCALALSVSLAPAAPRTLTIEEFNREFEHHGWGKAQGLPDERVKALCQTHDGYLWIGTQRGLARFDGVRFVVLDHLNTPELSNDDCRLLTESRERELWLGTGDGLLRFSGDRLTRIQFPDSTTGKVPGTICPAQGGGVWVGTDGQLSRINGGFQETYSYPKEFGAVNMVFALEEDSADMLWLGTYSGLFRLNTRSGTFAGPRIEHTFELLPTMALHQGENGVCWVAFADHHPPPNIIGHRAWLGAFMDGRWIRTPDLTQEDFKSSWSGTFAVTDKTGAVWLPSVTNGVNRFVNGEFQFVPVPGADSREIVYSALADREGNLWLGTEALGLQRWKPRKVSTYTTRDGLVHDEVWSISEARDGSIWMGTEGGLSRLKDGRFTNYPMPPDLPESNVRAIVEDAQGAVWFGTIRALHRLGEGSPAEFKFPGEWVETKIRALLPARDGGLWVGTVRGLTHLRNGQRTKYTRADGLQSEEILALLEGRDGTLWVGTYEGGLSRLQAGRFTTLTTTNDLSSNKVWALHEDKEGVLWAGTENGLNRIQNGQVTSFTKAQGLPDTVVNCILEDHQGRLWMSCNKGIYWVWKKALTDLAARRQTSVQVVLYDDTDGLPTLATSGQSSNPAGCRTRDGRLWFPTAKGVVVIDPSKAMADEVAPLVVVERVRANGRLVAANSPAERYEVGPEVILPVPEALLTLPPGGARALEFRYTANFLTAPEESRFRYRLVGLDEHWIEAGTRREAFFSDLRPGNYRFEVVAANHHGVWQQHPATLAFRLEPYFYQTWWFYLVGGCLAAALVGLFVAWRAREVRKIHHLERVNALDNQRRQIARDIHDELGASLTHILHLSSQTPGDTPGTDRLRRRTERIASIAADAVESIGDIVWVNNPNYDTLEDLVAFLREYAAKLFAESSIDVTLDFPDEIPPHAVSGTLRRHVLLLVKEALQNILKHAGATCVRLRMAVRGAVLEVELEDNGCGFNKDEIQRSANGILNMRERADELGATFELRTRPGQGTTVSLTVPL